MGGEGVTVVPYSGAVTERVEETSVDESGGDDAATGLESKAGIPLRKRSMPVMSVTRYLRPEAMLYMNVFESGCFIEAIGKPVLLRSSPDSDHMTAWAA